MKIANEQGFKTLAFPAISCGVYRFPILKASGIAINSVLEAAQGTTLEKVVFACFGHDVEKALLESLGKGIK